MEKIQNKKKTSFADLYSKVGVLSILIFLFIVFSVTSDAFLSGINVRNILRQVVVITIVACGEQLMLTSGMVDLSCATVLACAGTFAAYYVKATENVFVAILIGLAVGTFFGVFNGFFITRFNIPPFIGTLASMQVADGVIMAYTGGINVTELAEGFKWLGQGYVGPIPAPVIIMAIMLLITYFVLSWTPIGRGIYAVGGNEAAAKASGIRVKNIKFFACAFSGFCAGLAGIILMARMNSGQPAAGVGTEMDGITAVIVGGTSMSGGTGSIINTIFGSIIIGMIKNFMNLMNISSPYQDIVLGLIILVAVIADVQMRKSRNKA
jgi:inositol transport system permease protein